MSVPGCYGGSILDVDLSSGRIGRVSVGDYLRFVGGRGLGAKLYSEGVPPASRWDDPENELIFVSGPLTGIPGFASSRWQVYGKSPIADRQGFCYADLGGTWGVALKSTGVDAIVVRGRADRPVSLVVQEDGAQLVDASHLIGRGSIQTRNALKAELGTNTHVVAVGPAGENKVAFATIVADKDACGSAGFGAVFGSKCLKAIAVRKGSHRLTAAQPDRLQELVKYLRSLVGTEIRVEAPIPPNESERKDYCWGCPGPCMRNAYRAEDGTEGKFICQSGNFYRARSHLFYKNSSNDVAFHATNLCNEYGVDSATVDIMITWLNRCVRAGVIGEDETGLALSTVGSIDFVREMLRKVALREGFGDVLALGLAGAASVIGRGSAAQIGDLMHKAEENAMYGPRLYIVNGLIYAMEPRQTMNQLHETSVVVDAWVAYVTREAGAYVTSDAVRGIAGRFWGSEEAADFTRYEGKALAAKRIQDRSYAKECLILCDFMWPVTFSKHTTDHVGDPSLESRIFSAVTGWETSEEDLYLIGEQALNLQRSIMVREGHRGRDDDSLPDFCFDSPLKVHYINPKMLVPGPNGEAVCRKGEVVDRQSFERMKDEYYLLRGWDVSTGLPPGLR